MKNLILFGFLLSLISGCGEDAKAQVEAKPCECEHKQCEVKLSKPIWVLGTLCPAGMVSQGHGPNPQGQVVSGCMKLEVVCKP